jgi:uncharacterized membrane protein YdjX (TVP38/TMEM64 family)
MSPLRRGLLACLAVVILAYIYLFLGEQGILAVVMDSERLKDWVSGLGNKGPVVLIAVMAMAIVINPIPSAPIALAAGAAYGHTWGTAYVVAGATIGALGAFWIARLLGYRLLHQLFGDRVHPGWVGSQNVLTGLVFVSRLIPFISFDLVSYGAGLTPLKAWRFTLATVVGLIPASFLLAHFGHELSAANFDRLLILLMVLGLLTAIPLAVHWAAKRYRRRGTNREPGPPD